MPAQQTLEQRRTEGFQAGRSQGQTLLLGLSRLLRRQDEMPWHMEQPALRGDVRLPAEALIRTDWTNGKPNSTLLEVIRHNGDASQQRDAESRDRIVWEVSGLWSKPSPS